MNTVMKAVQNMYDTEEENGHTKGLFATLPKAEIINFSAGFYLIPIFDISSINARTNPVIPYSEVTSDNRESTVPTPWSNCTR